MAILYCQVPAGTVKVFEYTPLPRWTNWMAVQSGCQSLGQPSSLLRSPGMVTIRSVRPEVGAGSGSGSGATPARSVPTTYRVEVATAEPSASTETARNSTAVPRGRSPKSANTRGVSSSAVPSAT